MTNALATSAVDSRVGEAIEVYGRLEALRAAIAPDLNDAELQLFAMVSHRMGLDPFAREIHAVKRQGKVTFQVGIDGFRSKAADTGEYLNQDEPVFGEWVDRPVPHPVSAQVTIHRRRGSGVVSQSATAYWDEFYPGDSQGFQWKKMPRVMLAKCAEAMAFRKLFPRTFAGVYEPAEMQQAEAVEQATPVAPLTHRDRIAAQRASLEATTSAVPVADMATDQRPVRAEAADVPSAAEAAAESAAPSSSGAADDAVIDGQAVEVTEDQEAEEAAPLTSGELRERMRSALISISDARKAAKDRYGLDSIDALTDSQRGVLWVHLDRTARP